MVDESTATREGLDPFTSEPRLRPFSYGAVLEQSWTTLKRDYLVLLGATLIYVLVKGILGAIKSLFEKGNSEGLDWSLNGIDTFLVDPPFAVGIAYVALLSLRLRRPGVDKAFSGFRCYLQLVGITLVWYVSWLLPLLLAGGFAGLGAALGATFGGSSSDTGAGAVVGAIVGAVPAFLLWLAITVRLGKARIIALDPLNDASGVVECLRASWKLTDGATVPLMGLTLTALAIFVASGLACCLPAFFLGLPFLFVSEAVSYEMLRRDAEAREVP